MQPAASGRPPLTRLRGRLVLLAVVAALPLAVVFAFTLRALLQQQAVETERSALDLSRAIATAIDSELRLTISTLQVLALAPPIGGDGPEDLDAVRRLAAEVLGARPEWRAVQLVRPDGEVVVTTGARPPGGRVVEPESLAELTRTRTPVIGTLATGPGGQLGLPIRVPVMRDGELRYALTAVLRTQAVATVVQRQRVPDDWVVAVFDSRLARVARSRTPILTPAPGPSPTLRTLIERMGARPQAFGPTRTLEGDRVHTAIARIEPTGWVVALGVPTAVGDRAVLDSALAYGVALVLSVGLGGAALSRVSRRIEEPIQDLRRAAVALGRGEPVRGVPSAIAELASMSDALVVAAAERERSAAERESLLAAERQGREAAEAAQRRMRLLAGASALLSGSMAESATLDAIASLIVPDLADACRIDLLDAGGALQRGITRHVDPMRRAQIERFVDRTAASADTPGTFPWVIATGQTYLADFADPDDPPLDDPQAREFVRLTGIRSVFVVPLRARGQPIGALAVMQVDSGRRLTPDDCTLIGELAQRAALALDNARLLANLRTALGEASIASRAKDEFLAVLGHELRNPLAPIVTSLELMKRRGDLGGPERRIVERQVRHLMRLVDDLLDISRIASGKVQLRREVVDLRHVIERALELTQPALEKRRAPTLEFGAGEFLVDGDPTRLTQVVCNLLVNASKYSDPEQPITIALARGDGTVRLTVQDEGIGITAEVLPTVFDRFTQGEHAPQRSQGGLGLGLAIARSLVELHGGTIRAHSDGSGRGSRFVVELPSPASLRPGDSAPPAGAVAGRSKMVLVVDDNVDAADALAEMLTLEGHEVRTAASGGAALACLDDFEAEVALLDIGLPDMSGHELAARLRRDPRRRAIGLVALTGFGRDVDAERARDAGFDEHLAKPADIDVILALVARLG